MKTQAVYFRLSKSTVKKIDAEAVSLGIPPATLIRAIVDHRMGEPEGDRLKLLEDHEILLEATRRLGLLVQGTETYLRRYDHDEDEGLFRKLLAEIRLQSAKKE